MTVPYNCPVRLSRMTVPYDCPVRMSRMTVPYDCPVRLSRMTVPYAYGCWEAYKRMPIIYGFVSHLRKHRDNVYLCSVHHRRVKWNVKNTNTCNAFIGGKPISSYTYWISFNVNTFPSPVDGDTQSEPHCY